MKSYIALLVTVWLAAANAALAQKADEEYVGIYNLIMQADTLEGGGQTQEALGKYRQAQTELRALTATDPGWNPTVVKFRLDYLAGRISALTEKLESPGGGPAGAAPGAHGAAGMVPSAASNGASATVAPPSDWAEQLNGLRGRAGQLQAALERLQADKALLEAKLHEAFSVQSAGTDSPELVKLQQQVKSLEKDNELLKATLEQEKVKATSALDSKALEQVRSALSEANQKLAAQTEKAIALAKEKELLEVKLARAPATTSDPKTLNAAKISSAEADRQLEQQRQLINRLSLEKDALQAHIRSLTSNTNPAVSSAPDTGNSQARAAELQAEVAALRARLEALEARATPYTKEELALLQKPDPKPAQSPPQGHSIQELPPAAAKLVVDARQYFSAQQFDKAEAAYLEAAKLADKNVALLANLAAIQIERNRFDAADDSLKKALAIEPDDAYTLFELGNLRLHQEKYDQAVEALSRAAKQDPKSAEIQNYLGLALSEKGQRVPAEAALRKALELDPNCLSAHINLAVVYVTQQPPAVELARFHYQKALAAGAPRNPDLEKLIEEKGNGGTK